MDIEGLGRGAGEGKCEGIGTRIRHETETILESRKHRMEEQKIWENKWQTNEMKMTSVLIRL